ncbi:hypothetical protein V1478_015086 [Vespula squamosa]|uniref:Uncharacterized protein n=1 Tax=Vespula squamosa TaxID=30214 RepID=A0ABD2A440_VESSQ
MYVFKFLITRCEQQQAKSCYKFSRENTLNAGKSWNKLQLTLATIAPSFKPSIGIIVKLQRKISAVRTT